MPRHGVRDLDDDFVDGKPELVGQPDGLASGVGRQSLNNERQLRGYDGPHFIVQGIEPSTCCRLAYSSNCVGGQQPRENRSGATHCEERP